MKEIKRDIVYKITWFNIDIIVAGVSLVGLSLLLIFLVTFRFPILTAGYQESWVANGIVGTGIILTICLLVAAPHILRTLKEPKDLIHSSCDIVGLEVLDRFTFIKVLSSEEERLEFRYYIKTTAGNWQLALNKQHLFYKLQPSTFIQAAVTKGEYIREIKELEILSEPVAPAHSVPNRVTDKVISEVKVTGYRAGNFIVDKTDLLKEIKYYLVLDNQILPVSGTVFSRTRLNQQYLERRPENQHQVSC